MRYNDINLNFMHFKKVKTCLLVNSLNMLEQSTLLKWARKGRVGNWIKIKS